MLQAVPIYEIDFRVHAYPVYQPQVWELRNHEKNDPKQVPLKCRPVTKRYVFPEAWALGNLIASILAGTCACLIPRASLQIVILCYVVLRTLGLFVYQVNVLLFDSLANPQAYAI